MKVAMWYKIVKIVAVTFSMMSTGCQCHINGFTSSRWTGGQTKIARILYVNQGVSADLPCETGLSSLNKSALVFPKWTKVLVDDYETDLLDMTKLCQEKHKDEDETQCTLGWSTTNSDLGEDKQTIISTLHIGKVKNEDYALYECKVDGIDLQRIELRDAIRVTRRKKDDKSVERSVILNAGDTLYLYCNYTGVGKEHSITWLKDDVDITGELQNPQSSELFQNFTVINEDLNEYSGLVDHPHRGEYTCSVGLKDPNETSTNHSTSFPVTYSFLVRVRDNNRWMLPSFILLGEIVLLAVFTACIWKRPDAGDDGEDYADSEDEEETPKSK